MRTFDLASSYSREKFQNYLIDFLPDDYTTDVKPQYYDFTNIKEGVKLGQSEELDLSVFEFQIKSEHNPKITITKEVAALMKKHEYNSNALVVFYNKKSVQWRLSLITTDYEKKENKIIRQYSNPKRYSFLLGKDCKKHTPEKMLFKEHIHEHTENGKLITKQQDLKNRFALEVVGKEFFDEYKVFYEDFVQYITGNRYIKKSGKWEKVKIHEANNEIFNKFLKITNDNEKLAQKYVRDYIKKMMGRLVFLQFLQKKGWLGVENNAKWGTGDRNYIQNLFLSSNYKDDFLEQVLEPLFFGMLNTQPEDRINLFNRKHYKLDLLTNFRRVPYLNGGLFESDTLDDIRIKFPKELFSNLQNDKERTFAGEIKNYPYTKYCGLLDFFSRYNFTIDESDPSDTEIGVEPEMLGKIFENLLEDNKDKGAFYTPKEIVQYMCRESLISYLLSDSKIKEEHIRNFVLNHDNIEIFNSEERTHLLNKLKEVTICDPAVGSGAFPMGLLNELYLCRTVLEPKESSLKIKKEIVQKNIYGVDIDKGAVDIARLRFWLAIIVDEKEPLPLPNLDFKIMQGNSLIESYKGRDLSCLINKDVKQELFDDEEVSKRLEEEIENYYNPNTQQNKHEISNEIKKHLTILLKNNAIGEKGDTLLKDLEKIDLHANSEFFLWHTWFKPVFDKGGFNVVIGNPPYIGETNHKEVFEPIKQSSLKKFYLGKMDFFYFFFHLSLNILKENGICSFITTNYYITAFGAKKLRKDFKERAILKNLINFNELKIFESAQGQHNLITILLKGHNENEKCNIINVHKKGMLDNSFISIINKKYKDTTYSNIAQEDLYEGEENYIRIFQEDENSFLSQVLNKIKNGNKTLDKYCYIHQGLKTSADKVTDKHLQQYNKLRQRKVQKDDGIFVIDSEDDCINNFNSKEKEFLKPVFKNSDIKQYFTESKIDKYVLFIHKQNYINALDHPNILNHLNKYIEILQDRAEMEPIGRIPIYSITRPRETFMYETPKIVAPYRAKGNFFGYNENKWYACVDTYFINLKADSELQLKYILALLNSKLYYLWLYNKGKRKGDMFELCQQPLSEIPIKKTNNNIQDKIIFVVDKILNITKQEDYLENTDSQNKVKEYEKQIDVIVYKLYELTYEEILTIDKNFKLSKEEYNIFKI